VARPRRKHIGGGGKPTCAVKCEFYAYTSVRSSRESCTLYCVRVCSGVWGIARSVVAIRIRWCAM